MPNTSAKILGPLDIGDEFKIEETTKYLELSGSDKLIWSGCLFGVVIVQKKINFIS